LVGEGGWDELVVHRIMLHPVARSGEEAK